MSVQTVLSYAVKNTGVLKVQGLQRLQKITLKMILIPLLKKKSIISITPTYLPTENRLVLLVLLGCCAEI